MISLILRTATRFLMALLLLFSLFLVARGHNEPGGGFIGGLVASAAFALYGIAFDAPAARQALRIDPRRLVGLGLLVAMASGVLALVRGQPFMTGQWGELALGGAVLPLGSPLLFDVGVYIVVVGAALTILLALEEE